MSLGFALPLPAPGARGGQDGACRGGQRARGGRAGQGSVACGGRSQRLRRDLTCPLIYLFYRCNRFIPVSKAMTHHCESYSRERWPVLSAKRLEHWYAFIYKAILGLLPSYICSLITRKSVDSYSLASHEHLFLSVTFPRAELGQRALIYSVPQTYNMLLNDWKWAEVISFNAFKSKLLETNYDWTMTMTYFS